MERSRRNLIISLALITALALAAYGNSLNNQFAFDDFMAVQGNTFITSFENLRHFFDNGYYLASGETSWRAVTTLTYFIDYHMWEFEPFGYHLTNLILHILNGMLLYVFLLRIVPLLDNTLYRRIKRDEIWPPILSIPLMASLIFVTHPVQSEAVNPPGFRHEVLFTFFFLTALILYLKARSAGPGGRKKVYYALSSVSYLFSMLSKEMAIVLPGIILLIEGALFVKDRKENIFTKEKMLAYAGYAVSLVLYIWVRFFWLVMPVEKETSIFGKDTFLGGTVYHWFLTMSRIFASYIKLFIFPKDLTAEHYIIASKSITDPAVLLSIVILAVVFMYAYRWARRLPLLTFGILWIFIPLITVSNIVPLSHKMAERYLYICMAGFSLFAASGVTAAYLSFKDDKRRAASITLTAGLALLLSAYCAKAVSQNRVWHDNTTFWTTVVNSPGPHSARGYNSMGVIAIRENNMEKAMAFFTKALEVDPNYIQAYNNMALVHYKMGEYDKAIDLYKKVIGKKAHLTSYDFIKVYSNLGGAYKAKEMVDEAIECYKKALELNPYLAKVHGNLGGAYILKEMPDEAKRHYEKALELNPSLSKPPYVLGMIHMNRGEYDKAIEYFEGMVERTPDFAGGYYGLHLTYKKMGETEKSEENLRIFKELAPRGGFENLDNVW